MQEASGLIDCNNVYVSCERAFDPDRERVPVIISSTWIPSNSHSFAQNTPLLYDILH